MCFKYRDKQHNNKKHMAFQRMHPCSSERTETATFTSGEGDEDHVSNALKRLKEKKGDRAGRRERNIGWYD